jgi:pyrroloquinoline quinone (PQQ) biosynthesis protein C
MSFYDQLLDVTRCERDRFLSIPLITRAAESGVPRDLYLAFLGQAYHHVRHTCPLLELAVARCGPRDEGYRKGLLHYLEEERGHELWILEDIEAMGGDPAAVRQAVPGIACRVMLGYAIYAIEYVSPYALLGMVHVLEGMSARLAERAAKAIASRLGVGTAAGFSYLLSHGILDQEHVQHFETLVNDIREEPARRAIIETADVMYRLYGDIFRELERAERVRHAA